MAFGYYDYKVIYIQTATYVKVNTCLQALKIGYIFFIIIINSSLIE